MSSYFRLKTRTLAPLIVLLVASTAVGQDLTLKVRGKSPQFRSQAPIPLEFLLNWNSDKLIEGRLIVEVKDSLQTMLRFENPDIAMTFGDFVLPVVLPPLATEGDSIEIKARFESADWGPFDLGSANIKIPADWRRQMIIGLVTAEGDAGIKKAFDYIEAISLDRYRPKPTSSGKSSNKDVDVANVRLTSSALPARTAPLCAYDVIALGADSLQELRQSQRTALVNWVEAGGSLFVDGSGAVSDRDCDFLNEVANREKGENEFMSGTNDRLMCKQPITLARRGFGRVVVTTQAPSAFDEDVSLDVTCWLWKVRHATRELLQATGSWPIVEAHRLPETSTIDIPNAVAQGYAAEDLQNTGTVVPPYAPNPLGHAKGLKKSLLPTSVETVPLWVVMLVLGLFLLVIAPGDWYLLGKLNKRMLTWILFPASCIFFTGVMVFIARQYVGVEDYRTALKFIDWSNSNSIARITDVETAFTSTSTPVELKLDDQLFSYVETSGEVRWRAAVGDKLNGASYFRDIESEDDKNPTPVLIGRPTTLYNVSLPIRKWAPTVLRSSSFGIDTEKAPKIDWAGITDAEIHNDAIAVANKLAAANPEACVRILHGDETIKPEQPNKLSNRTLNFMTVATRASAIGSSGLFSVVSAISPNGHNSLEDVTIFDETNPDETMVIVVQGDIGDVHVHRRMFYRPNSANGRTEPPKANP